MDLSHFTLVLLMWCAELLRVRGEHYVDEQQLQTALLSNYTTTVRPNTTVTVEIGLTPLSLNRLDISQQLMSFTNIITVTWTDNRLIWTPSAYGQITYFSVPFEQLWTPALVVENAVSDVGRIGGSEKDNSPLRVHYSGMVFWYPPIATSTSCEMKIYNYPFDSQTCYIILTGWGLSTSEMVLASQALNLSYYSPNGEWELENYWTTSGLFYDGYSNFARIYIHFKFQRKWQFYGMNLVMPIMLTSILMCCVFALPIECGEKVGYSLTVLLSFVVFLTWVTDNLPSVSNDTSILQVYLAFVLYLGVFATLLTSWVVHMYHREPSYPMTKPMRIFVTHCLIPLRNCTCFKKKRSGGIKVQPMSKKEMKRSAEQAANGEMYELDGNEDGGKLKPLEEETEVTREMATWQEVAAMFDHLFLIVYLVVMPIISIIVLTLLYEDYY